MSEYTSEVHLLGAGESELVEISRKNLLSLTLEEMKAVRSYFEKAGREPTDCEIETIAQTWSEHCCHKVFRSEIEYTERIEGEVREEVIVLLDEIKRVTENINSGLCISVFKDNAGIIRFNEKYGIAFKVETHNHPSALEPYGGAGTGIGGVIRDILAAGKGAMPILNTDIFCLGMPDAPYEKLPEGVLHPHRIFRGVVSGVRDYGNRMGIPTASGAIIFEEGYQNNPLVFCGTVGVIPLKHVDKDISENDLIVLVGGRTGRDGIHGATFSSVSLEGKISTSVVQIGNPIVEKKMMDVLLAARDEGLYNSITDCGAGGLSSAVGEMGSRMGVVVNLEKVLLKHSSLLPWEIWISESQERMVLSVPEKNLDRILSLFNSEDVEATVIGRFVRTGMLRIYYGSEMVCNIGMNLLHEGLPLKRLRAHFSSKGRSSVEKSRTVDNVDWSERILKVLGSLNIASREPVIRQYDHEVQGHMVLKPLTGMGGRGPSDAAVVKPFYDDYRGIAVGCGINPFYGKDDPYLMAGCCIEESLRNVVAVGAAPEQTAILDNFCWGDLNDDGQLGMLVRGVKGCRDFALEYRLPFISGKDSLNNFFIDAETGMKTSIPNTLLISAVGIVPDIRKTVSSDLKEGGNLLYLCGSTRREMGGSQYNHVLGFKEGKVPVPVPSRALPLMQKIHACIGISVIRACHDCSDGGFAVSLLEMAIGGSIGAEVILDRMVCPDCSVEDLLFSESQGRFIVEVDASRRDMFEKVMKGMEVAEIGRVSETKSVDCSYRGKEIFSLDVGESERVWRRGLKW